MSTGCVVPQVTYCCCLPSKSSLTSFGRFDVLSSRSSRSIRRSRMSCASCCSFSSSSPSRFSVAEIGLVDTARLLLDKGADVAAANNNGLTALKFASIKGHEGTARLLLERGADIEDDVGGILTGAGAPRGAWGVVSLRFIICGGGFE